VNAPSFRVMLVVVLCGMVAGGDSKAHAQSAQPADGEPIIVGARDAWDMFELHKLGAAVDSRVRWRSLRRSTEGEPDLTDTEMYLMGRVELSGQAFVGHKNLLDISGRVGIGIEDTNLESDFVNTSQHDSDLVLLYDINAFILAESTTPITAYSRREETQLDREFAGKIDSLNTEHGVMVRLKSLTFPTFIHVFRRENDQSDQLGNIDYSLKQDSFSIRTAPQLENDQNLSIEYTLDLVDERQSRFYENSYTRHDAQISHDIKFGGDKEHTLRSNARLYDESGATAIRRYRLDEALRLRHTDRFGTRLDFAAEDTARADQWQRYLRAAGQARYELFESLIAIGGLGAERTDVTGNFSSSQYYADADLLYTKAVPYGRLDVAVGAGVNRQDNSEQGQPVTITDQALALDDAIPTILRRRNVVAGSVVVTDANGLRVYLEGIDYTIVAFPTHVEIRRVVGGAIAEGESLLVDYTVGPEPASTIDSTNATFSVRYTIERGLLDGLGVYLNYNWVDQTVDTIDPSRFTLDEVKDLRYGVDYRIGQISLEADRRNHDSSIYPYDTTRFEARYDTRMGPGGSLAASVSHEISDYPSSDEQRKLTRATIRARGRVGSDLDYNVRLTYRDESSRLSSDLAGFEQSLEVTWRRGRTVINASIYNSILESDKTESLSQTVSLGIRRTF
jgi:hypothetical protein